MMKYKMVRLEMIYTVLYVLTINYHIMEVVVTKTLLTIEHFKIVYQYNNYLIVLYLVLMTLNVKIVKKDSIYQEIYVVLMVQLLMKIMNVLILK